LLTVVSCLAASWLAVSCLAKDGAISADEFGKEVLVVKVAEVGAKWSGKVEPGDQIFSINGRPVIERGDVSKIVKDTGDKPVTIILSHRGVKSTLQVVPKNEKIGIAVNKPHEVALSSSGTADVTLARSPELLESPATPSTPDLMQEKPGTHVLGVVA